MSDNKRIKVKTTAVHFVGGKPVYNMVAVKQPFQPVVIIRKKSGEEIRKCLV
jgi:hypothetical protein